MGAYRLGIDIGGTFTDFSVWNRETGSLIPFKVPSTPRAPAEAVARGLEMLAQEGRLDPSSIEYFVHGTTIAVNTVIQRNGAKLALFVTEGCRDLLEIQRLRLPNPFDLNTARPKPLIPRHLVMEIEERLRVDGSVDTPVRRESVERAVEQARSYEVEGIVICFLHSYRNPVHEQQVRDMVRALAPQLLVSCSSGVWPEIREYERAMSAVINTYVQPKVEAYLESLERVTADAGMRVAPYITKSNGGIMAARTARKACAATLLSGPASGVTGANFIARLAGFEDILTLDMGGTSADIALIVGGEPRYGREAHVGDFPMVMPTVEVSSIGAGGGSVAWLDSAGVLKVGPRSVGSEPGPACYGRGGIQPALSDAFLLCGFLSPEGILGGRMRLHPDLAEKALGGLGESLGLGLQKTAEAIVEVAMANMYAEFSNLLSRRGIDPRDFTMVGFGGAGPMVACLLAEEFKIPRVLVPPSAGTVAALGALEADVKSEYVRTIMRRSREITADVLAREFGDLRREATEWLAKEGPLVESSSVYLSADMRYVGQSYELDVPIEEAWLHDGLERIAEAFHRQHHRVYGHSDEQAPWEMINLRVGVVGTTPKVTLRELPGADAKLDTSGSRVVYYHGQVAEAQVYRQEHLLWGHAIPGPAIVEQYDSTLFIPANFAGSVGRYGTILAERRGSERD